MRAKPEYNFFNVLKLYGAVIGVIFALCLGLYLTLPSGYLSGKAIAGGGALTILALAMSGDLPHRFGYFISGNRRKQRFMTGIGLILISVVMWFLTAEMPTQRCSGSLDRYDYYGKGKDDDFALRFHCDDSSLYEGRMAARGSREKLRAVFDEALANTSRMVVWADSHAIFGLSVDGVMIRDPSARPQDRNDFCSAWALAGVFLLLLAASNIRIRRYDETNFVNILSPLEAHEREGRDEGEA